MDFEFYQVKDSGAKEIPSSEEGVGVQTNERCATPNQNLSLIASFFPIPKKALKQETKNKEGQGNLDGPDFSTLSSSSSSPMSICSKTRIERKIKSSKRDSKPNLDQKSKLQYLLDFNSPRIELQPMRYDPLAKHREKLKIFQLISLDGEPIQNLVICTK